MATYNLTTGIDGLYQKGSTELTTFAKEIDFANFSGTGSAGAQNATAAIITIPAGFYIVGLTTVVLTAGTAAKTITVELSAGTDLQTATAIDAAAGTGVSTALNTYLTAGDTIQVKLLDAGTVAGTMGITVVGFQTPLTYTNSTYAF